jgi:hypothetical protein
VYQLDGNRNWLYLCSRNDREGGDDCQMIIRGNRSIKEPLALLRFLHVATHRSPCADGKSPNPPMKPVAWSSLHPPFKDAKDGTSFRWLGEEWAAKWVIYEPILEWRHGTPRKPDVG